MADQSGQRRFKFPRWTNYVVPIALVLVAAGMPYQMLMVGFALNPTTLNAGYQPAQPVAYSHELHAGQLGIDCRYCHTTVEKAAFAAIPPTQTCMNCHFAVKEGPSAGSSDQIARIQAAFDNDEPLRWKKVHDLPDYAFFNHSVHVNVGVSCVECHGRVDKMDGADNRVSIVKPLSMGWCVECHRKPERVLRPRDQVFNLNWGNNLTDGEIAQLKAMGVQEELKPGTALTRSQRETVGAALVKYHDEQAGEHGVAYLRDWQQRQDCSICHR